MNYWTRRIVGAIVSVLLIVLVYAALYAAGMATFEGESVSYVQALQVVLEVITTAGFGGHAPWGPAMSLFVILMNVTGVVLMFLAVPVFLVPLLQQAVRGRPPDVGDRSDHVVVCSYTPRGEALRTELEAAGVETLFVDPDRELVFDLLREDVDAIPGDPSEIETLEEANVADARAVVADVGDEENPVVILAAKQLDPDLDVLSVVEDEDVTVYHQYAGADHVVRPRRVLGESLATKARTSFSERLEEVTEVATDFEVTELVIHPDSDLAGRTLAEAGLGGAGPTVIGAWIHGDFVPAPDRDTILDENSILVVAGRHEVLEALKTRTIHPRGDAPVPERVVVCGYGVVGRTVAESLESESIPVDIVDERDLEGVDLVGDVTDAETLGAADVENARSVVLALDDDTTTVFATLVLEAVAPDVEIIARANEPENVWKLYNAGADYVVSLSTVTGRMLASLLIEGEDVLTPLTQFELVRTRATALTGRSLGEADVRARTGCTVVAVEREGELLVDVGPEFVIEPDDDVIVAGSGEAVAAFLELYTR
ncbi:potassium channel family protein [Natrialbaceae archaeon GCM10025810]|uniref:potassium channel family protein n=1 Tax=Halovalidus salilacus TaxID=3075124 RepID=UPI00362193C5